MKQNLHLGFSVGEFDVDPLAGHLSDQTATQHLQPKVMDVFVCLAEHAGELVERESILNRVWGRRATGEEVLTRCISELRSALGDDRGNPSYIQTVPKRGYRLLQEINTEAYDEEPVQGSSGSQDTPSRVSADPPSPATALASVAVLPFENYSVDENDVHIAEAFTSELHTSLARVDRLRIASRRSSFALSDENLNITDIGKKLNVHYVIYGDLRRDAQRLRVHAQLDECATGTQVWAQSYDRKSEDLLSIQRDIAEAVVASFATQKQLTEMAWAKEAETSSLDAWGLVQKARSIAINYRTEGLRNAIKPVRRAIEIDPDYAAAHATLASLLVEGLINGLSSEIENDEEAALEAAVKSVALAPRDPYILKMVALVWLYCGDCRRSMTSLRKAVQLAPFDFGTWGYMGWPLTASGDKQDLDELQRTLDRLLDTNPEHPGVPFWLYHRSVAHVCANDFDAAIAPIEDALEFNPVFALGWMHYANVLGQQDRPVEAKAAATRALGINRAMTPAHFRQLIRKISVADEVVDARTLGLPSN